MDTLGRTTAITVISAVPRWWGHWLRVNRARMSAMGRLKGPSRVEKALAKLSFIAFAHWSTFDSLPPGGDRRGGRRLPHAYLLFQSNFNGGAQEYIEAFSRIVPWGMRAIWGRAYGVPGPVPISRFERYIADTRIPTAHYYSAYPEASAKMVCAALEVSRELERFRERTAGLEPEAFAAEYRDFLTRVQTLL